MPERTPIGEKTPKGTRVVVVLDDGREEHGRTRSEPWRLGSGHLVVLVTGHSGGYDARRVFLEDAR